MSKLIPISNTEAIGLGIGRRTLGRRIKDPPPNFPTPVFVNGRGYFLDEELATYKATLTESAVASQGRLPPSTKSGGVINDASRKTTVTPLRIAIDIAAAAERRKNFTKTEFSMPQGRCENGRQSGLWLVLIRREALGRTAMKRQLLLRVLVPMILGMLLMRFAADGFRSNGPQRLFLYIDDGRLIASWPREISVVIWSNIRLGLAIQW